MSDLGNGLVAFLQEEINLNFRIRRPLPLLLLNLSSPLLVHLFLVFIKQKIRQKNQQQPQLLFTFYFKIFIKENKSCCVGLWCLKTFNFGWLPPNTRNRIKVIRTTMVVVLKVEDAERREWTRKPRKEGIEGERGPPLSALCVWERESEKEKERKRGVGGIARFNGLGGGGLWVGGTTPSSGFRISKRGNLGINRRWMTPRWEWMTAFPTIPSLPPPHPLTMEK